MLKKKQKLEEQERMLNEEIHKEPELEILRKKTIKELIAPSGIDASNIDHLEIISDTTRYARSFFVSSLPRMCTFPELFRDMYLFGDINTSVYINPIAESRSQVELNRTINQLETERIVAADRGNINRESIITQKRLEAEELRDQIASGFNKLYEATIVATLFAYNMQTLDAYSKMLATEMSKNLVGIKSAWANSCRTVSNHPEIVLAVLTVESSICVCLLLRTVGTCRQLAKSKRELARARNIDGLIRFRQDTTILFDPTAGEFHCPICIRDCKCPSTISPKIVNDNTIFTCQRDARHTQVISGRIFATRTVCEPKGYKWEVKDGSLEENKMLFEFFKMYPTLDMFRPHKLTEEEMGMKPVPKDKANQEVNKFMENLCKKLGWSMPNINQNQPTERN